MPPSRGMVTNVTHLPIQTFSPARSTKLEANLIASPFALRSVGRLESSRRVALNAPLQLLCQAFFLLDSSEFRKGTLITSSKPAPSSAGEPGQTV